MTLSTTDKQCRPIVAKQVWILVWEVAHIIEVRRQYFDGNTESEVLSVGRADKVRQEKLSNCDFLNVVCLSDNDSFRGQH